MSNKLTHAQVHAEFMQDPEYAAEYNKTKHHDEITFQLIKYRCEAGLTQAQLAKKLNTTQSVISRLESFEYTGMKLDTLINFADALDLEVEISIHPKNMVQPPNQVQVQDLRKLKLKSLVKKQMAKAKKRTPVAS